MNNHQIPKKRSQTLRSLGLCVIGLLLATLIWQAGIDWADFIPSGLKATYLYEAFRNAYYKAKEAFLNPLLYVLVLGIWCLELWIPVDKDQKPFSLGFAQDVIWFSGSFILQGFLLIPFASAIRSFHGQFLLPISINLPSLLHLSGWATFVLSLLVIDFLGWWLHLLHHRIGFLWRFHSVHHAQSELNMFTDERFHFGEALVAYPIQLLVMYLLLIPIQYGIYYILLRTWYVRLYHANLKTNFGPLRHVLVTPQSHRIHHSDQVRHYGYNYGVIFSIWDRIFRTQYSQHHEYPTTGIRDRRFPSRPPASFSGLVKNYVAQLAYPFRFTKRHR